MSFMRLKPSEQHVRATIRTHPLHAGQELRLIGRLSRSLPAIDDPAVERKHHDAIARRPLHQHFGCTCRGEQEIHGALKGAFTVTLHAAGEIE